ncbi:MAG TPA: MarR family EPS-associated transcriptional regulator [Mariprofundaceae bacterium]|nr:MarR family EPS-associated transcriptional regulator [Mariprofundaceae bacterium]
MESQTELASHYRLLKLIAENPEISQRELAAQLGLSLGKLNYCLKAFIAKGWVKASNFRRSDNKLAYAYLLTPKGIDEKARVTMQFFRRVEADYEVLKREVELFHSNDESLKKGFEDVRS